jgi:hypothetical protein
MIQDIIEQGEKELLELSEYLQRTYPLQHITPHPQYNLDIIAFLKQRTIKGYEAGKVELLQSIVEEIDGMKDYDIEDTNFDEGSPSYNETHNRGYHEALRTLKAKLLEGKNK